MTNDFCFALITWNQTCKLNRMDSQQDDPSCNQYITYSILFDKSLSMKRTFSIWKLSIISKFIAGHLCLKYA